MNALLDPFFTCLTKKNEFQRVSAMEALLNSKEIVCLAESSRDNFAILRFLLVLSQWLTPKFEDPAATCELLKKQSKWFELFGEARFFQVSGDNLNGRNVGAEGMSSRNESTKKAIGILVDTIPTANNSNFFSGVQRPYDFEYGVCSACCLKGMLRIPVFIGAGGRCQGESWNNGTAPGMTPCINASPPQYAYPIGKTLYETIDLNHRKVERGDNPTWIHQSHDGPIDWLEAFTWVSRAVYLHEPVAQKEICYCCGNLTYVVKSCYFSASNHITRYNDWQNDPHVVQINSKNLSAPRAFLDAKKLLQYKEKVRDAIVDDIAKDKNKSWVLANKILAGSPLKLACVAHVTDGKKKFFDEIDWDFKIPFPTSVEGVHKMSTPTEVEVPDDEIKVAARSFVARLRKLTKKQLVTIKATGFRISSNMEAYRIFANLWRPYPRLPGKIVPLLTMVVFANHPIFGGYRITPHYDEGQLLQNIKLVESGVNYQQLIEDLYVLSER